jgi:hypothetical protein
VTHQPLSRVDIEGEGRVVLKPALQFSNRDEDLAAASDQAQFVPYVLIKEVARNRKRVRSFVYRQRQTRHCPSGFSHRTTLHSAAEARSPN